MSNKEQNIAASNEFFVGEDKTIKFEIFSTDGSAMENVSGWTMTWILKKVHVSRRHHYASGTASVTLTTGGGEITITGTFNSSRSSNTQRVVVAVADTATASLEPGTYTHALKRMDAGEETVLSFGTVELLVAAVG